MPRAFHRELVEAALAELHQPLAKLPPSDSLVGRLAVLAAGPHREQPGHVLNQPCDDRVLWRDVHSQLGLQADFHSPQVALDLLHSVLNRPVGSGVVRRRVLLPNLLDPLEIRLDAFERLTQELQNGRFVVGLQDDLAIPEPSHVLHQSRHRVAVCLDALLVDDMREHRFALGIFNHQHLEHDLLRLLVCELLAAPDVLLRDEEVVESDHGHGVPTLALAFASVSFSHASSRHARLAPASEGKVVDVVVVDLGLRRLARVGRHLLWGAVLLGVLIEIFNFPNAFSRSRVSKQLVVHLRHVRRLAHEYSLLLLHGLLVPHDHVRLPLALSFFGHFMRSYGRT